VVVSQLLVLLLRFAATGSFARGQTEVAASTAGRVQRAVALTQTGGMVWIRGAGIRPRACSGGAGRPRKLTRRVDAGKAFFGWKARKDVSLVVVSNRVQSGVVYHWPNASHLDGRRPSLRNIYNHSALRSQPSEDEKRAVLIALS
jgi:hypothetical protein